MHMPQDAMVILPIEVAVASEAVFISAELSWI